MHAPALEPIRAYAAPASANDAEARAALAVHDLDRAINYLPFVTFWQVTADLLFATSVPDGHGHRYRFEYVDAWNGVLQPPGITRTDLATLRSKTASR